MLGKNVSQPVAKKNGKQSNESRQIRVFSDILGPFEAASLSG